MRQGSLGNRSKPAISSTPPQSVHGPSSQPSDARASLVCPLSLRSMAACPAVLARQPAGTPQAGLPLTGRSACSVVAPPKLSVPEPSGLKPHARSKQAAETQAALRAGNAAVAAPPLPPLQVAPWSFTALIAMHIVHSLCLCQLACALLRPLQVKTAVHSRSHSSQLLPHLHLLRPWLVPLLAG